MEHMEIHGVNEDLNSTKVDNLDSSECNENIPIRNGEHPHSASKKFRCRQCPYLSNNKTHFLYHKQFHRPRAASIKCLYCTYNVSRRHLLHQHLRLHYNQVDNSKVSDQEEESIETFSGSVSEPEIPELEMPEIPQVWVLKLGDFFKMYKCRYCPHVSVRRSNIQDHEKMHRPDKLKYRNMDTGAQQLKLRCPDCNYTCTNAGILATHMRVHQGYYGDIQCLVDPTKSDSEQLKELRKGLSVIEPVIEIKVDLDGIVVDSEGMQVKAEPLPSQTENYNSTSPEVESPPRPEENTNDNKKKVLNFCNKCPARFILKERLKLHSKFHLVNLPFQCSYCSYTARQKPHLLTHYKVHSQEYQNETTGLVNQYTISFDDPRPPTEIIANESDLFEGPVWMVRTDAVLPVQRREVKRKLEGVKPVSNHVCPKCPATFVKLVALKYHLTLHGGSYRHKCTYCDYTVKTYGNLIKHQLVHEKTKRRLLKPPQTIPISGTELFRHREAQLQNSEKSVESTRKNFVNRKTDRQFGRLMHGSTKFIYPTSFKNGKVREKKFKCHKCPSAFDKRDQYHFHLSLHGSNQRYRCEKCDYSVKCYANYPQHMKVHLNHEKTVKARISGIKTVSNIKKTELPQPVENTTKEKKPQTYELTQVEQQNLMLQKRKKQQIRKEEDKKNFSCAYCPFVSHRRDAVDNHMRRHYIVSGIKSGFECTHCDYSAAQGNFLRDHNKLHFKDPLGRKPEAYLKCEKMELWCWEEKDDPKAPESKVLLFQDRGEGEEERFLPPIVKNGSDEEEVRWKVYVNPETGELVGENGEVTFPGYVTESNENKESNSGDLSQDIESHLDEEEKSNTNLLEMNQKTKKIIKKWGGKNWKCKKCPHAFQKKDQYFKHITLHGSNQRHTCNLCDYSVKFYSNYLQHMRMHQTYEPHKKILVKKNSQSSSSVKVKKSIPSESEDKLMKSDDITMDEESDSFLIQKENMSQSKEEESEREFSSLTEGMESSAISAEDKEACVEGDQPEVSENISLVV